MRGHHELAEFVKRQRKARSKPKDPKKICWNCHATEQTATLRKCQGCEKMRYCSGKCAEEDWKWHKDFCRKTQEKQEKDTGEETREKKKKRKAAGEKQEKDTGEETR